MTNDKLLIAMDIDDYTFDSKTRNFYSVETDIFGDLYVNATLEKIKKYTEPNESPLIFDLRQNFALDFNNNKQLDYLVHSLNLYCKDIYKQPQDNITYKYFYIEY